MGQRRGTCQRELVTPPDPGTPHYDYPACTLEYALSIAVDGNTMRMAQGDYDEQVEISKSVTLLGGYLATFADGTADPVADPATRATNLRGATATPIITLIGQNTTTLTTKVVLDGLRLFHTTAQDRAISMIGPVTPTVSGFPIRLDITRSKVQLNTAATGGGGGINVDSRVIASIGITGTEFTGNKGTNGGAIALSPGSRLYGTGARFTSNEATAGHGGAISAPISGTITLPGVTMSLNKASGNGGAIYAQNTPVTLDGSITGSDAGGLGGGLYLSATVSALANLSNVTLTTNKAASNGGAIFARNMALTLSAGTLGSNTSTSGSGGGIYASGGTITLGPLPITNNKAALHGGGIYRENGGLTLTNNTIMTNTATGGSGGGIAFTGNGVVSFSGVRWFNNQAGGAGGAAAVTASQVTLTNSPEIRNNRALGSAGGGGLYINASGGVTLTNNSLVRDNQATNAGSGGAFYVAGNSASISGNNVQTNTASIGGGIYLSRTLNATLSNNVIQFNRATTGSGGGLYLANNARVNVTGLNLARNQAQLHGGGLYAAQSRITSSGAVTLTINTAKTGSGGGIYLAAGSGLTATTISFISNVAQVSGGGLFADQATFTASTSTTAISNTATTESGGALYFNKSQVTLGTTTMTGNRADDHGGAVFAAGSTLRGAALTAERNSTVTGNGGVFSLQASSLTWTGASTTRFNRAQLNGGAYFASASKLQIGAVTNVFSNTAVTGSGGGIYLTANAFMTLTAALDLQQNLAQVDGGGLYASETGISLQPGGVANLNRAATGNGGALNFANNVIATFGGFTFDTNRAQQNGGAVRAIASTLTFAQPIQVTNNRAIAGDGGGFHLTNGLSTNFARLTLGNNIASANGGGIYATDVAIVFGNDSIIQDNQAQIGSGGGVYLANGEMTTTKISFLRNKAKVDGGGLYALGGPMSLANSSLVQANEAQTGNGGGVYAGGGAATLTGVIIEQNIAQLNGGGLYLTGNPATTVLRVQNSSFIRQNKSNVAQGGGLFVTGGIVVIDTSTVSNNRADQGGGGLFQSSGTLTVTNSANIAANTTITGPGGGLAVISGTVNIINSTVQQNSAYSDGGGLYAPDGQVRVANSRFSDNSLNFDTSNLEVTVNSLPIGRGGGIYVDGKSLRISQSQLTNNKAKMGGGAIYATGLFIQIANSQLTTNDSGRGSGGASYFSADLVELLQNTFDTNQAAGNGGSIAIEDTAASTIISNTITNNFVRRDVIVTTTILDEDIKIQQTGQIIKPKGSTVTGSDNTEGTGGAFYYLRSTGNFVGNMVLHNENQSGDGGGLFVSSSNMTMINNVVAHNAIALTETYASGIYIINSTMTMRHNTIADNSNKSTSDGSLNVGVYVTKSAEEKSTVNMTNNIVAGHETGMMLLTGNTAALLNNLFLNTEEDWGGPVEYSPSSGNKIGDPLFVDADNDNYDITRQSAAFDIGLATDTRTDIRGVPRPRAFGVDAGAYEQRYQQGVHMRVTASPIFVGNGEEIEYHVQVVNHSPVPLNVTLNFELPSQQTANDINGPGCSGVNCSFGIMAPEATADVTLVTTANGTPPDQGFIEMLTTVHVSVNSSGPSDTTQTITTRLQKCRISYNNVTYATIGAAITAANTTDDLDDIIKVSGYCGGSVDVTKKVTIQGGWNFNMDKLDPAAFPTTIDGGGSGRVLRITGDIAPTIQNIILRGGNASGLGGGPSGKDAGGIVYIKDARATLDNVRMVGGRAAFGAGLYVDKLSAPIIRNSIIENGQAGERGGGVYAHNSSPELTNVTIRNNTAKAGGGAYLYKSEAKIVGCTISNNRATGGGSYLQVAGFNIRFSVGGGGGVNFDESKASISGSTLENNTAKAGGAVFADNSPGTIIGSLINNNEANGSPVIVPILVLANEPGGGGAVYAQRSDMVIEHNRITNNRATSGPGGAVHIFNGSSDAKINGNFFGFNSAGKGSAVYVHLKPDTFKIFVLPLTIPDFLMPLLLGQPLPDPPKLTMMNNTFAHNGGGSVVHLFGESYGELVGNIFAFNGGTGVVAETGILPYLALIPVPIIFVIPIPFPVFYVPKVDMNYTLWYQNSGGDTSASGVGASVTKANDTTGKDPAFKNDGFHIKRISAAYNAGKNTGISVDIDGQSRPQADITDMGADEYPAIGVRYVAPGGGDTGGEFCRNFLNPCGSLQVAIDNAREGDLIKMAGGTYTTMDTRNGQTQMGYITKTLTIQGGYYRYTTDNSVTEGRYTPNDWEVPFPDLNPTILDGQGKGRIFYVLDEKRVDSEGNPIAVEPTITGVTVKNGNSAGLKGPQGNSFDAGGAIYLDNTKAKISNVDISNSTADFGGAVYMISSTLSLDDVSIRNNIAITRGGGFYLETSNDVIINNIIIEQNKAPLGGGLYLDRSNALIQQNQIRSNGDSATTLLGGGLFLDNSSASIISNTITANIAANGAGVYAEGGSDNISGNTITNNKALNTGAELGRGGGCYTGAGSTNVNNNVIQGNQAILGAGCFAQNSEAIYRLNQIIENVASNSGGGLYLLNSSEATIQENFINLNRANSTLENNGGGGLFVSSSNATIRNNTVTNNTANAGGGLYLFSFSNANVEENNVSNNTATQNGGAFFIKLSNAQLNRNTITSNRTVQGNGGGIYIELSSAALLENTIEQNAAILGGGGVYLDKGNGASLESDSIRNNTARDGAGIFIFSTDTARFEKVAIEGNRASQFGAGMFARLSSVPVEGLVFAANVAQVAGGGIYMDESNIPFSRNVVRNNEAGQQGGGVAITHNSFAELGSNVVIDNKAGTTGSGIYIAGSEPSLIHTTIARNLGGDGTGLAAVTQNGKPSVVSMVNSIVAGQSLGIRASTGNTITLEATLWANGGKANDWKTGAGVILPGIPDLNFQTTDVRFQADGYHLQNNSKAIGVGVDTLVSRDIDGDGRPQGNGPELGADELLADCAAVIPPNLNTVYTTLQAAINESKPSDEIHVSGTCVGALTNSATGTTQLAFVNKPITVRGGYTPSNWLVSFPITQPTFLDAQGLGRVFFIAPSTNATIENLNLAGGMATGQGGGPGGLDAGAIFYARNASPTLNNLTMNGGSTHYGGALYLENSTSKITNSTFESNQGVKGGAIFLRSANISLRGSKIASNNSTDGGGIFLSFSQPLLESNTIELNSATGAGGGLFLESSSATMRNNGVFTNTAETAGGIYVDGSGPSIIRNFINGNVGQNAGGLYLSNSTATVNGNQMIGNSAASGGGIYIQAGNPTLDNNVVAKNISQIQGAAIYVLGSSFKLRHNTLATNTGGDGSGIFITDLGAGPSTIELLNSIMVDHAVGISLTAGNKITLRSDLLNNNEKNWGGGGIVEDLGGHVTEPPLFVNPDGNNYHLQPASPARDSAADDVGILIDYDNQARPADNGFDMGADEFVFSGIQVFIQTVPDPVVAGADFQLIVRVVNIGNIDQTANVTVTLPPAMTPNGVLPFFAEINRGETWVQVIDARINPDFSGALKITADVTTSANASESIEASIDVTRPEFGITLVAEASPSPVQAGEKLLYQIRLNNTGNQSLTPSVVATLPDLVSTAAPMILEPPVLEPGGTWTKSVLTTVSPDATGSLTAVFRATTLEGPTAIHTLTVPVAIAGLLTGVSVQPDPVVAGENITYTIFVTNVGNIDFTTNITFVAPVDETGAPLVAPGGDQLFTGVSIPAGQTWIQTIVVVAKAGYTGPLTATIPIATHTGLVTEYTDVRQVVLPDNQGPTIVAVNDGPWEDPNTWQPKRVPDASDIVHVPEGITVVVDGAITEFPLVLTGLINEGTIILKGVVGGDGGGGGGDGDTGPQASLEITDFLNNTGVIQGADGEEIGDAGTGLTVTAGEILNGDDGVIRGGNGADGGVVQPGNEVIDGGNGGAINVFAQNIINDGSILGGNGGALESPPATSGNGGDGGNAVVAAGPPVPALLENSGLIAGGDGGDGPGGDQGDGNAGDGGSVGILSASQYNNRGGRVRGGFGGDGDGDGRGGGEDGGGDGKGDGAQGGSSLSAQFIWDNGIMSANGRDFAFSTLAVPVVRGVPGAVVPVPITFINEGLRRDNYLLIWSNSASWTQDFLPQFQQVDGLRYKVLFAPFTIPVDAHEGQVSQLRMTASSQGSATRPDAPTLVQEEVVRIIVLQSGGRIFLPSLSKGTTVAQAQGQPQAPPEESQQESNFLPLVED